MKKIGKYEIISEIGRGGMGVADNKMKNQIIGEDK